MAGHLKVSLNEDTYGKRIRHEKSQSLPCVVFRMNSNGSANFDIDDLETLDTKIPQSMSFRYVRLLD